MNDLGTGLVRIKSGLSHATDRPYNWTEIVWGRRVTGRIFINYRRGDDPGYTQALYQRLEGEFGRDALFMDVEGYIKAGDDFVHVLDAQVAQSDVLLALIGPRWIDAKDESGMVRLLNPDDFVRIEIASALEGHADRIFAVAYAPDGNTALSGSADDTLKLWNLSGS